MKKRVTYTEEPIKIGKRVGTEILPGGKGASVGAARRPAKGKKS